MAVALTGPSLPLDALPGHPDFVHLSQLSGLAVDLRYATADNFVGRNLYAPHDCAWLRREAAEGLQQAQAWLHSHLPGHRLCVLDALRPQRVQEDLWAHLEGSLMQRYVANPVRGSTHSFGMAVDVTVLTPQGEARNMGSAFDALHPLSHPEFEAEHLALGQLEPQHLIHRGWLRRAMRQAGFTGINTEWWHYDFGDREAVRRDWPRVV